MIIVCTEDGLVDHFSTTSANTGVELTISVQFGLYEHYCHTYISSVDADV